MIRTQIYLPEEQHKAVTQIAKQRQQPMAEVIRLFIKQGLQQEKTIDKSGMQVMKRIAAMKLKGGPVDLSENHDYYLYGGGVSKK